MWRRFALYGLAGWVFEVVMTGAASVVSHRDVRAPARTYLWMHPIWGAGGLALEGMSAVVRRWPRGLRCLAYVPVMYSVEYAAGWLLRRFIGHCPWDYRGRGVNIGGLVRADYAPLWMAVGFLFEPVRDAARTSLRDQPASPATVGTPLLTAPISDS